MKFGNDLGEIMKRFFIRVISVLILCIMAGTMVSAEENISYGLYRGQGKARIWAYADRQYTVYIARYDVSGANPLLLDFKIDTMQEGTRKVNGVEIPYWYTGIDVIEQNDMHEIRYMVWDGNFTMRPITDMIRVDWSSRDNDWSPEEIG